MTKGTLYRIILVLILVSSAYVFQSVEAQSNSENELYLPLVRGTPPNITGSWIGYLIQPGKTFEFELNLAQNGNNIQGTSTARDESYFAFWALSGTTDGNTFNINELNITNSNPRPGTGWCIKQMNLTYSSEFAIPMLTGNWSDPGCNSGQLYLQAKSEPFLPIDGIWAGVITQGTTEYALELVLQQNNSLLQGSANIRRGNESGRLSLIGYVAGSNIRIEEQSVLETTGINWCIKTMTITYKIIEEVPTIEGSWRASGCSPGNLILRKQ